MQWIRETYLERPEQQSDWRVGPLLGDLAGSPPAYLIVGSLDPLLDDSHALASRLKAAGVPCDLTVYEGIDHGSIRYGRIVDALFEFGGAHIKMPAKPSVSGVLYERRGLSRPCPAQPAPGRYSRRLAAAAGARGTPSRGLPALTPRRCAHRPRPNRLRLSWQRKPALPSGETPLHTADMAARPIEAAANRTVAQRAADPRRCHRSQIR